MSVTLAPLAKGALHVPLAAPAVIVQEMPDGLDVTVPFPNTPVTVSVKDAPVTVTAAVAVFD